MTIFPFIVILVIMYFMVFRPQQKKLKAHQEMLNKLKRNDEVMTSGGIYGKVTQPAESRQEGSLRLSACAEFLF